MSVPVAATPVMDRLIMFSNVTEEMTCHHHKTGAEISNAC